MGQDYSYSQPSRSSEEYDYAYGCLLQGLADCSTDEGESNYNAEAAQPECDDGVPKTCYCGAEPVVATAYTSKDPGRKYFTCENSNDGDCHVWKWLDVAVLEELSDIQRQVRMVKEQGFETITRHCPFNFCYTIYHGIVLQMCKQRWSRLNEQNPPEVHGWICLTVPTGLQMSVISLACGEIFGIGKFMNN